MARTRMVACLVVLLLFLLCLGLTLEPGGGAGLAVAIHAADPKLPWPEPAVLLPLLRKAAAEVAAVQGDSLGYARATTFEKVAEAQASIGDQEGVQLTRERAVNASAAIGEDRCESLLLHAHDLARAHKTDEAERAYEDAADAALGEPGNAPKKGRHLEDTVCDGIKLAAIFRRNGEPEAARRVLVRARTVAEDGGKVLLGFFVVRVQAKHGDSAAARASLDSLQRCIDAIEDPFRHHVGPDAVVAARWSLGDKEAARALCKAIGERVRALRPDQGVAFVLPTLSIVLEEPAYWPGARESPVWHPGPWFPMQSAAMMLAMIEDYEGAFRLVAEEIPEDRKGLALESLIEWIGRGAGLVLARDVDQRLNAPIDRDTARNVLRLAAQRAGALDVEHDRLCSLAMIVELQARLGDLEGARRSLGAPGAWGNSAIARSATARALADVARAEGRTGSRVRAEAAFATALVAAETLPERDKTQVWIRTVTTLQRDEAIDALVMARAEQGDVDRAIATAGHIREVAARAQALVSAARSRASLNDQAGALRLAEAPGHGFPTLPFLVEIADAQSRAGDRTGARATLQRALKVAEDYHDNHFHDPTIPAFNPAYDVRPLEGRVREIAQESCAALWVAQIRSRLGDIPGAQEVMKSVKGEYSWSMLEIDLPANQLESGDTPGAFNRAFRISSPSDRLWAIYHLSDAIIRHGCVGKPL